MPTVAEMKALKEENEKLKQRIKDYNVLEEELTGRRLLSM
jgi:cell shape-determining protein MreC